MTASKVRADYEQLTQIAQAFGRQAECAQQLLSALQKDMGTLQGGDWMGKGADKFYAEMKSAVLPAMERMAAAMNEAASTTVKINRVMKQAEDESAALFRLDGAGSAPEQGQATYSGTAPVTAFTREDDGTPAAGPGSATGSASPAPAGARHKTGAAHDPRAARVQPILDEARHLKEMYEDAVAEKAKRKEKYEEAIRLHKDPREILRLQAELRSSESAEKIYEVEMTRKYNEAIDLTVRLYKIDLSAVNGKPEYWHGATDGGNTLADRSILVGPDGVAWSPGWLASTLGHEAVHARQQKEGRLYPMRGENKQGALMNDVECFQWELDNAARNGLAPDEIDSIRDMMENKYLSLREANQERVNRRIFAPAPENKK